MSRSREINRVYRSFCEKEGNQFIASEYAINRIQELIDDFCVKKVFEIGVGIGSIAASILHLNRNINYFGTENNDFCLQALLNNLGENYSRLKLFSDLTEISISSEIDLLIIDGKDPNLPKVTRCLSEKGIIVVEGDRVEQLEELQKLFPHSRHVHSISLSKNRTESPFSCEDWQGGVKVIFVNPNLRQKFWWLKEKMITKLKYQYPGRHFGENSTLRK